jgi:hypothetical protein
MWQCIKGRRRRGQGAVGRRRNRVTDRIGYVDEMSSSPQKDMRRVGAIQTRAIGQIRMPILEQAVALLRQIMSTTESTVTTTVCQAPRNSTAHICLCAWSSRNHVANPLVSEDRRRRLAAASIDGVNVGSAKRRTPYCHDPFTGSGIRKWQLLEAKWLTRTIEDLRGSGHFHRGTPFAQAEP